MLAEILEIKNSGNILTVLKEWISRIIGNMEKPPKGKKITIFASTNTIKDYKTGLIRAGHRDAGKTVGLIFDKSLSQKTSISKPRKIDLSLRKINPSNSRQKRRIRDRDDDNFLILIEAITKMKNREDHGIIFASKDRQSAPAIKDAILKSNNITLQVALNLEDFERSIEC